MPYKDRTTGLIVFGAGTIFFGLVAIALGALVVVSQLFVPKDQSLGIGALLPSILVYVLIGIALIVLGIGSIMTKRWARALLLIFSWCWLALGVIEAVAMAIILPHALPAAIMAARPEEKTLNDAALDFAFLFVFGILGVFFILLPGIWTFFYYSPHVKATCDARDPNPSWTDRCPLPVLGICLWVWICVPTMLLMPFSGHLVLPIFGTFATGMLAGFLSFCLVAVWAVGGWLTFRLDIRGWWLVVIVFVISAVSSIYTFCFHDIGDLYRAGNYPPALIDQISKSGFLTGSTFVWATALFLVPFLGYLLFIRRYFSR